MAVVSMKQLLEAGVHFGHQTRRWNPKMAKYIFTERNGIYIIDLQKTVKKLDEAYNYVKEVAAEGGDILFVGTKKQAQESILPYLCGGGAFNIFLIRQFVRSIPRELDEAATIDGAGYFRILLNVIVPSIKSAMIVVAMFLFIQIWNDLLQQMIYINTDDKFTISMGLSQLKGSLKTDWSAIMCGTCMSFVPGVVFYLLGQRYFVEGIVMTGMKN